MLFFQVSHLLSKLLKIQQFTFVLDACVLYPAPLIDLLIELAIKRMFRGR